MRPWTKRALLRAIDAKRIEQAIIDAERETTGELRVSVAPFFVGNVMRTARRAFDRLGMANTRDRNAILVFVVPARHRFAILGDEGIDARVGQATWDALAKHMGEAFRQGAYTDGLVETIAKLGELLREAFPRDPTQAPGNQLPDAVDFAHL